MKTRFLIIILCCSLNLLGQVDIHKQVDGLIMERSFEEAEKVAKEALKKNPKDPHALCALACVYRNMSYKEVIQFNSSNYVRNDSQNATVSITSDNLEEMFSPKYMFVDSIFQKSEKIYYEIINEDPHFKDAYMNLINAYENDDEFEKYHKAVALFTNNNKDNSNTKYILMDLASKLFRKNKLNEAIKMYANILSVYPDFSECVSDLGAVYFKQGEFLNARNQFEKSYSLNQNDTLVINNLVNLNIILGDNDRAFKMSQKLIEKTSSKFSYFTSGCIGLLVGNNESITYLKRFQDERKKIVKTPIDQDFWFVASSAISKKDLDIPLVEEVVNQFYSNNYHYDLIVFSEIILKKHKDNPFILQVLTSTYESLQFTEKVLEMLAVIESYNLNESIMPETALMFNYGRNYFVDKQYKKAIDYMLKVSDEKQKVIVNYLIGESYYYLKDYKNSIKYHRLNSQLNSQENMQYINWSLNRLRELN